jgi:hypothetical protein
MLPGKKGEEWRVFTPRTLCSSILATLVRDAYPLSTVVHVFLLKNKDTLPLVSSSKRNANFFFHATSTKLFQSAISVPHHA